MRIGITHPDEYIVMVMDQALSKGLRSLESNPERMHSLTGIKWITSEGLAEFDKPAELSIA